MAIGTVLEDHFLFIICQVKLLMSSVRREAAYHDHWGRGVVRRVGLLCPVTVRSVICVTWLSWERVTCHESRHQPGNILSPCASGIWCLLPSPLSSHLPLFESWDELKEKESTLSAVKWEIFERWEKNIFDDDTIFALMRRGRCWFALAHL